MAYVTMYSCEKGGEILSDFDSVRQSGTKIMWVSMYARSPSPNRSEVLPPIYHQSTLYMFRDGTTQKGVLRSQSKCESGLGGKPK